jgi:4-amino-4-deoxy-L-arabinose transferase-like glycosyltransferase
MGGSRRAEVIAMLCALFAPIYLSLNHFYSMNALDMLLWAAAASLWLRCLAHGQWRHWLLLGCILGLGLLNKISVLWLGFGLGIGLLLSPHRSLLKSSGPWLAIVVALLFLSPHILWQVQHGWPTVEFIRNATSSKMVHVDVLQFIRGQIDAVNMGSIVVWLPGLGWVLFAAVARPYRSLGFAYVAIFALLALSGSSRDGYLSPAYTWLFAAGAVVFDRLQPKWRPGLLRAAALVLIVFFGSIAAPFGMPILPVDTYQSYAKVMGVAPSTAENKELAVLPQFYADMHGWKEFVATVAGVYQALPAAEQAQAAIFTYNYGEAGAIDHLGRQYDLPRAISGHNNYWLWGPLQYTGEVVILIGNTKANLEKRFAQVELGAVIDCGLCMPYENGQSVWICRGINQPIGGIWPEQKHFD